MGSKSRFPQREVKCGTVSECRLKHPQTQHAEIELEINLLRKRWNCERQSLTTSRIMIIWRAVEAIEEFRWIWCEGRINMITFLFPKTNHNIEMSISFSLISCPWVCLFCFSSYLSKTAISWTNLFCPLDIISLVLTSSIMVTSWLGTVDRMLPVDGIRSALAQQHFLGLSVGMGDSWYTLLQKNKENMKQLQAFSP